LPKVPLKNQPILYFCHILAASGVQQLSYEYCLLFLVLPRVCANHMLLQSKTRKTPM